MKSPKLFLTSKASAMDFDLPEGDDLVGGGTFVSEPGTYHMNITEIKDGLGPNGNPIEGFTAVCQVLESTVPDCAGKSYNLTCFPPDLSRSENSQNMAKRLNAAFAIATNLVGAGDLGKRVKVDVTAAAEQQFIITLEREMEKGESGKYDKPTKFLRPHYADIFHVDDPDAANFPKSETALSLIDSKNRRAPEWFGFKKKTKAAAAPAAKSGGVDYANL